MYNKMMSSIVKEKTSHFQNQWQFKSFNDTQKYPTLQTQDYKFNLEHNFG